MKILYHFLYENTLSAGRTIANGYKNAFKDLGHDFNFLSIKDDQKSYLIDDKPDIFFTSLSPFPLKYLDLSLLKIAKKQGTKVFVNIPFWSSPLSKLRITESPSIKDNKKFTNLIQSKDYGDVYFNICEQDDPRMDGFEKVAGMKHYTVLLAADKTIIYPEKNEKFKADISYLGTNLPQKRSFFKNVIYPMRNRHNVKIYGQDWTIVDKSLGYLQKIGQYFDFPYIKDIRKPKLDLSDERKIYSNSIISVNIHEEYQKKYGDINERTFKIPLAGGFEIVDNVISLKKYFKEGKEIIIAKDEDDWREKIDYYIDHPDKRLALIEEGRRRVLKDHTYHHRVKHFIKIFKQIL